jgi:hypothetical protein
MEIIHRGGVIVYRVYHLQEVLSLMTNYCLGH